MSFLSVFRRSMYLGRPKIDWAPIVLMVVSSLFKLNTDIS